MDAILKREYGIHDINSLSEDDWLRLYAGYRFARKLELQEIENSTYNALAKIVNQLFSNNGESNITMDIGSC